MKSEKDSQAELDAFLKDAAVQNDMVTDTPLSDNVARLFAGSIAASSNPAQSLVPPVSIPAALSPKEQLPEIAIAKDTPAAPAPVAPLLAARERSAIPTADELATQSGKRPLTHFGQARPATKSKTNRKLVLQLTPEMYQYFAHVANLPGLDGVPLSDLAVAILYAWREDYRPEIKKANAAFKA